MITDGYVKMLTGKCYYEIRITDKLRFRGRMYSSLSALKKSLPIFFQICQDKGNYRKLTLKNSIIIAAFRTKKNLVGYSRPQSANESIDDFIDNLTRYCANRISEKSRELTCFEDESKNAIRITSVGQFLNEIESIPLRKDNTFYFRGHSSYLYKMIPGIYRKRELIDNEDIIHKELLIRCPDDFEKINSTFEMLVKMQHYSLPTRLLDLTTNPLIALYFSCCSYESDKHDGEVKVLSIPKKDIKYFDSDTVTLLSNITKQPKGFSSECINDIECAEYRRYMDDIKKEKPYFTDRVEGGTLKSVVCVKPKLNNARIVKQDGAFLIFGINGSKRNAARIKKGYYSVTDGKVMLVDNGSKEKIIKQLEKIGISDATIYPEIDKVSEYISKRFGEPESPDEEQDLHRAKI